METLQVPSTRTSHNRIPHLLLSCGTSSERPGKPVVLTEKVCSSPADSRWYFFLLTMLPVRRNLSWRSGLFRVRNRNLVASQASQRCLESCGGSPLMSLAVASTPSGSNYQLPQRGLSSAAAEMTHQRIKGRRRFYKEVTIREKEAGVAGGRGDARGEASTGKRWEVLLDNRVLKTPARRPLEFDTADLAMAVASEWDAQTSSKGIEPALMPLMSLASTAIDQVALDREKTISTCLKYLPTDTVCFLSPEPDPVITRRQRQLWSPIREWSEEALGIPVATTTEIHRKPEHPPEALFRARELLESLDEWALSAVQSVTMECKSLLIALALVLRKTTAEKAFDAARLEEEYNVERWGMIEGGHDMDRANTTLTLTAASTLMWLRPINLSKEPSPAQLP